MRKKLFSLIVLVCILISLAGCTSSKAYTFSVTTGDSVKLSLDTTDDYDITSDMPFVISCGGETLSQGQFIPAETYEQYAALIESAADATVLDSGTKDGNEYVFWAYNDSEFNYAIMIGDSATGLLLGNNVSEASARECFERLTITLED